MAGHIIEWHKCVDTIKALKALVECRYESSEWGVAELQTCKYLRFGRLGRPSVPDEINGFSQQVYK